MEEPRPPRSTRESGAKVRDWTQADVPATRDILGFQPFPATSWSLVADCAEPDDRERRRALQTFAAKYWHPVFSYVLRRAGRDVDRAKDLTQEFFLQILDSRFLEGADPSRGSLRGFVLVALQRFLSKSFRSQRARKRRPEQGILSLEALVEDRGGFDIPGRPEAGGEAEFDDEWRRAVLAAALAALRSAARDRGKEHCVDLLVRMDLRPEGKERPSYETLIAEHGLTHHQVASGLHWARKEMKRLVLEEIREQAAGADDFRREARTLFGMEFA